MKLNKSARYALYAAVELAQAAGGPRLVTVGDVARRFSIPEGALARVLQHLVRAGIAAGTRGVGGGYRLARPPSDVTVLDVIEVFDPPRRPGHCVLAGQAGPCGVSGTCRLRRLFDEVDETVRSTFASVTLATLVAGPVRGLPLLGA